MNYFLLLFILLFKFSFSQQLNYFFISPTQGLPSSEVYAVLQDKQGYMWFATNLGVSRYDGKKFFTYTTANGLLDNTVFRMCEDKEGRIWFGSQSNELCYWKNNRIYHSPISAAYKKLVKSSDLIKTLYADSAGRLWINTQRRTLIFTQKKNTVEFQEIVDSSFDQAHLIAVDNKKVMYSVTKEVDRLDKRSLTGKPDTAWMHFIVHASDKEPHYASVQDMRDLSSPITFISQTINHTGIYYFATNQYLFIIEEGKAVQLKKLDHSIANLIVDCYNNLWIGYYKAGAECYKNCDLDAMPLKVPGNYTVDDVCTDHEGGIWLATLEKGVVYVPSTSILVYSNVPQLNDHITFIGKGRHTTYVNTFGNNTFKENKLEFIPDDFINTLSKSYTKLYYITSIRDSTYLSFSYQLIRLDPSGKLIVPQKRTFVNGFFGGKSIIETGDHTIWMVYGGGLKKVINPTGRTITYFSPDRITSAVAAGNDIFVGGKKGLYLFKNQKYLCLGYVDTLLKSSITDMARAQDGSVWITTIGNGVLRFKDNKIKQFTERDGLISNICTTITIDDHNNIWAGSNKGISYIEPSYNNDHSLRIKNITQQNGLNSNEISKLFATGDSLWVGTMSGLSWVYIPEIIRPLPPSPIYISNIKVNNRIIDSTHTLFSYNENNMRFFLHGLTFKDNANHQYRYRLTGFDTAWQETGFDELTFNNLSPGAYRFDVQVANNDRIWSPQMASYSFMIRKPFWFTWWFIALEIIALIVVVYLIILWRIFLIKKKEAEKLRINKLLAEYQMKALTAQMNPHFIFNAINSIQNFIIQNHSTLAYDYLIKFSKLIRLVLNNSNEKEITLQQELDTLAIYIELEQLRFQDSFDYQLDIDPQLDPQSLLLPSLLLQPYIENAIWHGLMPLKTHKGVISLIIQKENELLKINITDNGVGRKASDQIRKKVKQNSHRSVGMELTGKRIELFGHNDQFSIQIIDNYDDNDYSTGTTVEIILPMIEMY